MEEHHARGVRLRARKAQTEEPQAATGAGSPGGPARQASPEKALMAFHAWLAVHLEIAEKLDKIPTPKPETPGQATNTQQTNRTNGIERAKCL